MGLVRLSGEPLGLPEGGPGRGCEGNPLRCEGIATRLPGLRMFPGREVVIDDPFFPDLNI